MGDHDDPSYSLLPPQQTLDGPPFRCRIIIYEMNNRWAYVCVLMRVRLYDFDKDVQHKSIWVTLSTCCVYQK